MTDDLRQQKLDMWRKKLAELEKELEDIIQRRSEAAAMGDLRENAAYQLATEDAENYRARIADVQKIISDLEDEDQDEKGKKGK